MDTLFGHASYSFYGTALWGDFIQMVVAFLRHGVKPIILALRHRGDGGKLIVMRLIDLEEYVTDLITWQQRVDNLLHEPKDQLDSLQGQETQRPHWEPRTKADIRPHVIGNI